MQWQLRRALEIQYKGLGCNLAHSSENIGINVHGHDISLPQVLLVLVNGSQCIGIRELRERLMWLDLVFKLWSLEVRVLSSSDLYLCFRLL